MGVLKPGYGLKGRNFTGNNNVTWELDSNITGSGFVLTSDTRLTDARPASDVYAWAKNPVKPTYTYAEVGAVASDDARLTDARTPVSHVHGNISNGGTIGTTSGLPLITTVSGAVTVGAFGTTASSFCVGNDSRLSDARTPVSHVHGNISNGGTIGTTSGLPIITTVSGALTVGAFGTTANSFCQGNDARLSDSRVASDVYAWAKAAVKPSYTFSEIGSKPTTLVGYGITNIKSTDNSGGVNPDNVDTNGFYYCNSVSLFGQTDGGLYNQSYMTTAWQGQIFQDYRTGQIALRGRNNTTWGAWRAVLDSVNVSTYAETPIGTKLTAFNKNFGTGASDVCVGNDARLSDARIASDVYAWAKAAVKPSYTYTEVGAAPASHTQDISTITGRQSLTIGSGLTSSGTFDVSAARTVAINYAVDHTFSGSINVHRLVADDGLFKGQLETNVFVKNSINVVSGDLRVATASKTTDTISNTVTSIPVVDGSAFAITDICTLEGELVRVTDTASNTLTVTRGFGGTTGATHSAATVITKSGTYNTANKGYVQIKGQTNVVEIHKFDATTSAYTDTVVSEFGKLASVPVAGFNGSFGIYTNVAFIGDTTNYMNYKDGVLSVKGNVTVTNTIPYNSISSTPTSLTQINAAEGNTLALGGTAYSWLGTMAPANTTIISGGYINTNNIQAASIAADKLVANSITASQIASGTITATQIAAGTITSTQIAATTITAAQIAANTITASQIASGTITATQIASGTITATQIAASTITSANMNVTDLSAISANLGTITAGNITMNTVSYLRTSGKVDYGSTVSGIWMGYDSGAYKVSIGNATNYLKWTGDTLDIRGNINADDIQSNTELVVNGDFSSGVTTGWTPFNDSVLSVVGNKLRVTGGGGTGQVITVEEDTWYTATITSDAQAFWLMVGGTLYFDTDSALTNYRIMVYTGVNTYVDFSFFNNDAPYFEIADISLKKLVNMNGVNVNDILVSQSAKIGAYNLPLNSGSANQVLKTDGSATASWVDTSWTPTDITTSSRSTVSGATHTHALFLSTELVDSDIGAWDVTAGTIEWSDGALKVFGDKGSSQEIAVDINELHMFNTEVYYPYNGCGIFVGYSPGGTELVNEVSTGVNVSITPTQSPVYITLSGNTVGGSQWYTVPSLRKFVTHDVIKSKMVNATEQMTVGTYNLPVTSGSANQVLKTDGSATASWVTPLSSVASGNGMDFSTITATGTVSMGTPGDITPISTNTVSATSHTHAITGGYLAKAMVNADCSANSNVSATYVRTGTTVVVTLNNHGHIANHQVYCDFTSGGVADGFFTITSADTNTFTFTHGTSGSASGNVTLNRRTIRSSFGIHSVIPVSNGIHCINISTVMADANYIPSIAHGHNDMSTILIDGDPLTQSIKVHTVIRGVVEVNPKYLYVIIF